jgi:hypothetical protein
MQTYTLPDMQTPDDWWVPMYQIKRQDGTVLKAFSNGMKMIVDECNSTLWEDHVILPDVSW